MEFTLMNILYPMDIDRQIDRQTYKGYKCIQIDTKKDKTYEQIGE